MKTQLRNLLGSLKRGDIPRLVVIAANPGTYKKSAPTDAYLASETLDVLCKTLLPDPEDRDLSLIRFSGTDSDFRFDQAMDEMRSGSFFGAKKVVVIRRFRSGSAQGKELDALGEAQVWEPSNIMLLWAEQSLPSKLHDKLIRSEGVICLDAKIPYKNEVPAVVGTMARRRKKTIQPRAAQTLMDLVGTDLTLLWMEVCKLSDYVGDRSEISDADVLQACGESAAHDVFSLVDAIARPDHERALHELERLMDQQVQPLQLIGLLAMQFRRLLVIRMAVDEQSSVDVAAKTVGVQPWLLRKIIPMARRVPAKRSMGCLSLLRRADHDLKTLRTPPRLVFENCVLRMMRS